MTIKISKIEHDAAVAAFIEAEQEKYEMKNGVLCNYTPFLFTATLEDEIIGAVSGSTFFSEIYIDELVVKEAYRRKGIGTRLVNAVEKSFKDKGFSNINCCTNRFQATGFYEKCGFELEFVREHKTNRKLDKFFYIKYLF